MIIDPAHMNDVIYVPQHNRTLKPVMSHEELSTFIVVNSFPQTKYKDLEEVLTRYTNDIRRISVPYFPLSMDITKMYSKVTDATSLTTIGIDVIQSQRQMSGEETTPIKKLLLFGRIASLGGPVVREFDDSIDIHDESSTDADVAPPTFKEIFPLRPGKYRLSIAVQDPESKKIGISDRALLVPE